MINQTNPNPIDSSDKLNLLIVDDDVEILYSIEATFRKMFKIFTAQSITQAYDIIQQADIHIIICDERLPGESGTEFLTDIKEKYPSMVRIILSAYTDSSYFISAINNAHVFKFITKPWNHKIKDYLSEAIQFYHKNRKNEIHKVKASVKSAPAFNDLINKEISRSQRYNHLFSCIMIKLRRHRVLHDTDEFPQESQICRIVAQTIVDSLREGDIAGHIKESTFLLLLSETNESGVKLVLERLEERINRSRVKQEKEFESFEIHKAAITISNDNILTKDAIITFLENELLEWGFGDQKTK